MLSWYKKQAFGGGYIKPPTSDESHLRSAALFEVPLSFSSLSPELSAALLCLEAYYTYGWIHDSRLRRGVSQFGNKLARSPMVGPVDFVPPSFYLFSVCFPAHGNRGVLFRERMESPHGKSVLSCSCFVLFFPSFHLKPGCFVPLGGIFTS